MASELSIAKKNIPKKSKADDSNRTGWVLMPVLVKEGACKRCKQKFDVTKDSASSCCCHVDSEGKGVDFRS